MMTTNLIITQADLQRVHQALRITVPLGQLSPVILKVLTMVAWHWKNKTPTANVRFEQAAADFTELMK